MQFLLDKRKQQVLPVLNSNPVVTLDIKKKSGGNLIEAAASIQTIVNKAKAGIFPKDLDVVITNDQSKMTKNMITNLENSIIMGVLLVVGVLVFFLGVRNSLFVGIAIPLSMLMGIAILNFSGTTLNMMVLFSLILALGMLVDNGNCNCRKCISSLFSKRQDQRSSIKRRNR